jgi:solute carrier family 25, member 33/36
MMKQCMFLNVVADEDNQLKRAAQTLIFFCNLFFSRVVSYSYTSLLSGGVAGTIAACLTNPLEVIKTQLQSTNTVVASSSSLVAKAGGRGGHNSVMTVTRRILAADGPAGFLRGLPPTIVGIIPSRSAYFYAYHRSKQALGPYLAEGSPPNALVSGLLAGIVSNTLTNPIWMVRTRMQILADASAGQIAYKGYGDAIATIFREEGMAGFYKGIRASYWGCAEGSIQFIIYEQLKAKLSKRHNAHRALQGLPPTDALPVATYFWSAAAAKMLASVATYPHEVARTRMREQARAGVFKYKGMWQTLGVIAREEGRKGLYSGLGVHLLKVVPNSAFMFLT